MIKDIFRLIIIFITLAVFPAVVTFAQTTTGKIAGRVTDAETNEPLPGVNVVLEGTSQGAATDAEGYYAILNVDPGAYSVAASMIGYQQITKTGSEVTIGHTTTVDFSLKTAAIAGEAVTVEAEHEVVKLDLSASSVSTTPEEIESTPMVTNINEMINLEAGVEGMSIRGGSADETSFMMDGLMVVDNRASEPMLNMVNLSAVKSLDVIKGGFNAEYGNVRSGVITVVTKDGRPDRYTGSLELRYSPPRQKHSGPSVFNWQNYYLRPYLDPAVRMDGTDKWPEEMQRQYPTFEGWKAVSERLLSDGTPDNDQTPEQAMEWFMWQHRVEGSDSLGQTLSRYGKLPDYYIDGSLGGPVPFVNSYMGNLTFFLSHKSNNSAFALPLPRDYYRENNTQLKITSHPTNNLKLTAQGIYVGISSVALHGGQAYPTSMNYYMQSGDQIYNPDTNTNILYWPDGWSGFTGYRSIAGLNIEHTLSANTFYEANISYISTRNDMRGPLHMRDTTTIRHFGGVPANEQPYGWTIQTGEPGSQKRTIDGFAIANEGANARDTSYSSTVNVSFDITSQVNRSNMVKSGLEFNYDDFHIYQGKYFATNPDANIDLIWNQSPIRLGAYIQDKFEFEGMIANFGLRMDYDDPMTDWYTANTYSKYFTAQYEDQLTEQASTQPAKSHLRISPRLGISFPTSAISKFYFNYGHFYSLLPAHQMYEINYGTNYDGVNFIGNPSADPARTVAYELGAEYSLLNQFLIHVSGYYKDVTGQASTVGYTNYSGNVDYSTIENNNYSDIRGFEVKIDKRYGWVTGWLNYDYRVQTAGYVGRRHYYEDIRQMRIYGLQNPYQERPLARPLARAFLRFRTPQNFGPSFGRVKPLGGWSLSFLYTHRAGEYETWDPLNTYQEQDNIQWKDYNRVDAKISYDILSGNNRNLRFYLDITNVFNINNLSTLSFSDGNDRRAYLESLHLPLYKGKIYQDAGYTAGDDRPGDLKSDAKPYIDNPNRRFLYYTDQRYVTFGLQINF